ncbi:MAG: hypothetical protein ABW034_15950 [Steroidobacteraceae bacterium]
MREQQLLRPASFAVIAMLLSACSPETKHESPDQGSGSGSDRARMAAEFSAIQQRAGALNEQDLSGDPAQKARAQTEAAKVVTDLRHWASEFKQESHDKRVPNDGNCPWLTESGGEQCVRTHVTQDFCDYFCVDIPQTEPAQPAEPL